LYASPNIIRMIKIRCGGTQHEREMRNSYKTAVGKPDGRDNPEDPCVDGRIILEWILVLFASQNLARHA